jgi:hypothetical protein
MGVKEIGYYNVNWILLAQNRDKWRAFVKTVIRNFGFHKCGEFVEQIRNC